MELVILFTGMGCIIVVLLRMASSGMLRRVALVRTDVSEELSASIMVTRFGELGTTLDVTSIVPSSPILVTMMNEALSSSETSVLYKSHTV
jgi:hypothetical protein